ncbi:lysophospholipid acyltransferase family protein [Pseudocnuella soli]|uniref:lysophospholipid acyltransferase family protein n=1 Tax=Pseudocnuella soli TaxID=2502779 RepID=UPI001F0138FC|nr:lysophospholipid acyltransferase family protein [Pseudocnuella soli]
MNYLVRPLQILYNIYAMVLFVAIMLLLFPFVIIASFFGKIKGGNAIWRICCIWGDLWFPLIGIIHRNRFEVPLHKGEPQIFVANHVSYIDAAIIVKVFRLPLRALGKVELSKVPLFGFIYRNAIVTVDRSSAGARAKSVAQLKAVLRKGISVLVFPEGTFNETGGPLKSFYDGAFRVAIETGTPIRPVLLLDTWSRMPPGKLFTITPGRSRAVFLEPVPVDGYTLQDVAALREKVYAMMEAGLVAHKAAWIRQQPVLA